MSRQYTTYKEVQINSASPLELVLILYDGIIRFLNEAMRCTETGDIEGRVMNLNRVADILNELTVSLNFQDGKEAAQNLHLFYAYLNKRLIEANVKQSLPILEDTLRLVREVRETWAQVITAQKTASKAPVPAERATLPTVLSA